MTRRTKGVEFPGVLAACLLLAMLVMAACSKETAREPLESNLTLTQVSGAVDLMPGGRALRAQDLTVRTSAGTSSVAQDGRVTTVIFEEGPQYAELLDNRDRTVMLAFASQGEPDFSALSTAKAVGYLALAGPWLLGEGRLKLLDEIDTAPGFVPVLNAVQSQLSSQGFLDLEAADLRSALLAMSAAIHDMDPASDLGQIVKPHGVIAEPTTASGLSLDTTVDSKLTVENVYLRRVSLLFRRLSYKPAADAEVVETNAFTRVDMDNVERYAGIVGTLEGFLEGKIAYSPVRINPPLDIPRYPADAKSTTYQMYAIGPAFSFRPGLEIPADVLAAQELLEMKAFFLDVFVVLMANVVLPLKGDQIDEYLDFIGGNAILGDFIATMKGTVPDVWAKMQEGKWGEAAKVLARSAVTSNTILPLLGQLTLDFLWKNTGINRDDHEKMFAGMNGLLDKMGKIDMGLNALDTGLLVTDMARSNKVERFIVTTTPGKVTLAAASDELQATQTTTISATIQDKDPNGVYEYQWSVSPNGNYWVEDSHLNGTDDSPSGILVTDASTVNIRSLITTEGVAIVTCRVYRTDGGRQEIGHDEVTITFTRTTEVTLILDEFKIATTAVQLSNGRFEGRGGLYMDLSEQPRIDGIHQYWVERVAPDGDLEHISLDGTNLNQPIRNEYTIDSEFGGFLRGRMAPALFGQVGAGMIRVWFEEKSTATSSSTSAAAMAAIDATRNSWIATAKNRKVKVVIRYAH